MYGSKGFWSITTKIETYEKSSTYHGISYPEFNFLTAQCIPFEAGSTCLDAPICCEGSLEGFYGTMSIPTGLTYPFPECNGVFNNAQYLKFVAGTTYLELGINAMNCTNAGGLSGLQAGIFENCIDTGDPMFSILDAPVALNCNGNVGFFTLTAVLELGKTYYLVLDGFAGSVCDYDIIELEGTTYVPPLDDIQPLINGPAYVQNNETYTFETNHIDYVANYDWTVTGGSITAGAGTNTVTVEVSDDLNFEICIKGANDCTQTQTTCQAFEINPDIQIIEASLCEGECYILNNTSFCSTGVYDVEVDNGNDIEFYRLILDVLSPIQTNLSEHICFGDNYTIGSMTFNATGTYSVSLTSGAGCDSIVSLDLLVLDSNEPMVAASAAGELDCANLTTTLLTTTSFPIASYLWSGPGINANNKNDQNPEVGASGLYAVIATTSAGCSGTATTVVLGEPGIPMIDILGNDPINCNNEENTIVLSGVISGLNFEWSGPGGFSENGPTITTNTIGEYLVDITTPSGCMTTITINVETNNEPLFVDPGPSRHIQCEFVVTLDAPGAMGTNVSYEWTTLDGNILFGGNTLNPVVNSDGTYTLTATDLTNGCVGSADMVVYADMAIIENEYLELTCAITNVQLDGSESYDGPDAFIQWSSATGNFVSGENTLTPIVDAPGIYQLIISRPGCLSFATVTVIDNAQPPAVNIDVTDTVIGCFGPVTLNAVTNAINPQFEWTKDGVAFSQEESFSTNDPGIYILSVISDNACVNTASITITSNQDPEFVAISGDLTLDCALNGVGTLESFVGGTQAFYDYSWFTLNGGSILNGAGSPVVTILGGGTYCLEVLNFDTGCSVIDCVDVIEVSNIDLDPTVTDAACPNSGDGSITLNVSGGTAPYTFTWENSNGVFETSQNVTDLDPGNYSVSVTDSNDCMAFQSFTIEVGGTEDITANAGVDQALDCLVDFIVLDGGASVFPPGAIFQWVTNDGTIDAGGNTLFPSVSSAGTYILNIFSLEGCDASDEVVVTDYTANAGPNLTLDCNNPSIQLEGGNGQTGATYEWITNDGNITEDENTLSPSVDATGSYILIVTLANGCSYTDETNVDSDFDLPNISIVDQEVLLENCNETVTLEGESTTVGVTYFWSGGGISSNESELEVEEEGIYTLVITAPNGCTSTMEAEVIDATVPPILMANTQYINCFNGNPLELTVNIETQNNNIEVIWETLNGSIVDEIGNTITVDQAGAYQLRVIDNGNNCDNNLTVNVEEETAQIAIETTIANCGIPDATATAMTTFIHEPKFVWSTGETTSSIGNLAPGTYSVTITSPTSTCDEVRIFEIEQDPSCFVVISGNIYDDTDLTCDPNGFVQPKGNVLVSITPEDAVTATDANGYYEFLVPPGDYTVRPELISPFVVECPGESISVSVPPGSAGSENNDFFVKALSGFDLYVTAGASGANAGSNQFYQISFCNNWFTTIFGTVEFTHDPLLEFDPVAAGASSYDPATHTAVWEYEDLSFFECEYLNFTLFVPANVPDGTVINSSVVILPLQGDIAPENNSTSWIRTVSNSNTSNTSLTNDETVLEETPTIVSLETKGITVLRQYPNPFTTATNIEFELEKVIDVELQLFDASGRLIKTYSGFENGFNQVKIAGNDLPGQGIFFYKIIGENTVVSGKMIRR